MLQAEQILQKRYQLQKQLGQNAGRQTWLAKDLKTSKTEAVTTLVIIKLLAFNPQMHWDELKLFEREAQVLKHIKHPHIPQYHDYFALEQTDNNDLPWFGLVQEYMPGNSLQILLDKGKHFTEKEVKIIATELLKILIYLHELSPPVLHRDIKPSNLILGKDKQIYLVDFGAVQDKAAAEGATFTVVGTSGYAPPEQLWGKAVAASDLYAMGATLIQLLTGIAPADLPLRKMRMQFADKVRLDANFTQWLTQLTEPAPEQRFSSAKRALLALEVSQQKQLKSKPKNPSVKNKHNRLSHLFGLVSLQILIVGFSTLLIWSVVSFNNIKMEEAKVANEKAKQQNFARQQIDSMLRTQVDYYLKNQTFVTSINALKQDPILQNLQKYNNRLLIQSESYYNYSIQVSEKAVFHYARSKKNNLNSYVGAVFLKENHTQIKRNSKFVGIVCVTNSPDMNHPLSPFYKNRILSCPPGTKEIDGW